MEAIPIVCAVAAAVSRFLPILRGVLPGPGMLFATGELLLVSFLSLPSFVQCHDAKYCHSLRGTPTLPRLAPIASGGF